MYSYIMYNANRLALILRKPHGSLAKRWVQAHPTINDKVCPSDKVAGGVTSEEDNRSPNVLRQSSMGKRLKLGHVVQSFLTPVNN